MTQTGTSSRSDEDLQKEIRSLEATIRRRLRGHARDTRIGFMLVQLIPLIQNAPILVYFAFAERYNVGASLSYSTPEVRPSPSLPPMTNTDTRSHVSTPSARAGSYTTRTIRTFGDGT